MSEILFMSTTTLHTSAYINESILSIIKGTSVSHSREQKSNSLILILCMAYAGPQWFGVSPGRLVFYFQGTAKEIFPLTIWFAKEKWPAEICAALRTDRWKQKQHWLHYYNHHCYCIPTVTGPQCSRTDFTPQNSKLSLKLLRSAAFSLRFWSTGTWSAEISSSFICGGENSVNPLQQRHKAWKLWTDTLCLRLGCGMLIVYHSLPLITTVRHTKHGHLGLIFGCWPCPSHGSLLRRHGRWNLDTTASIFKCWLHSLHTPSLRQQDVQTLNIFTSTATSLTTLCCDDLTYRRLISSPPWPHP